MAHACGSPSPRRRRMAAPPGPPARRWPRRLACRLPPCSWSRVLRRGRRRWLWAATPPPWARSWRRSDDARHPMFRSMARGAERPNGRHAAGVLPARHQCRGARRHSLRARQVTATIIDGKAVAARLRAGLAARIATLPFRPGLRVVRVGEDPASGVYVRNKDRAAAAAGFDSATIQLPAETRESELLNLIADLNID